MQPRPSLQWKQNDSAKSVVRDLVKQIGPAASISLHDRSAPESCPEVVVRRVKSSILDLREKKMVSMGGHYLELFPDLCPQLKH